MAKRLKPYKVDVVQDQNTGASVEIFLDREKKDFFGKVGLDEIHAPDLDRCKTKVREALKKLTDFEWKPVIVVSASDHDTRGDGRIVHIDFSFRREEQAPLPLWMERKYTQEHRVKKGEEYLVRPLLIEGLTDRDIEHVESIRARVAQGDPDWEEGEAEATAERMREVNAEARANNEDVDRDWRLFPEHDEEPEAVLPYSNEVWLALLDIEQKVRGLERTLSTIIRRGSEQGLIMLAGRLALPAPVAEVLETTKPAKKARRKFKAR